MKPKFEFTQERRPCNVLVKSATKKNYVTKAGHFHGIWQHAHPYTSIIRGTTSGQISDPIAVVEVDGKLLKVELDQVEFTDVVSERDLDFDEEYRASKGL
ncbi:MAG: hypothetical protein L0M06_16315 [Enterococcus sp.]|uniref:hypothetical protein n=1 Tax=Enterococcus sp. TaxID=35783 RepID=UPI0026474058|nr:hypothetical protein [Enterococcus sp.]MDN6003567.1 hypothetical protein [Enterococcus sp.]MDN6562324.1 hypothetical protein [Enterococcus sp.]MDN6778118.1 hypothetical protein [Enterococcus sp.]